MKKSSFFKMALISFMLLCMSPITASAAEENGQNNQTEQNEQTEQNNQTEQNEQIEQKKGLTLAPNGRYCYYDKNGKKVRNSWREVDGKRYYFQASGWAVSYSISLGNKVYVFNSKCQLHKPKRKSIFKSKGYYYYVNPDGTANTGWLIIKNRLYKAYSKSGRFAANRTENGIRFGKNGAAVRNTASKLKMKTMKIVSQITNKRMSKSQKLKACWNYIVNSGKFKYYTVPTNIWKKGWQQDIALRMLTNFYGDCNGFGCAFAALASEIGYNPYVISGRVPGSRDGAADGLTSHCWIKINGEHYDPEGTWAGWAGYVYGSSSYPLYHTITQTINFRTYI